MVSILDVLFLMGLGFSLAAPLGPVNMEIIKRSLQSKSGFFLGVITGIGAMTGDFLIASTVLFVGDEYLRSIVEITWVYMLLLGLNIFILSYIGISALRSPTPTIDEPEVLTKTSSIANEAEPSPSESPSRSLELPTGGLIRQYFTGFVIVVTSPWSYFWWLGFGSYILNSGLPLGTLFQRLIVTIFFLSGIFIWVISFSSLLGISQRFASPRILTIITRTSALIILGFAVKILYDGLHYLHVFV